MSTAVPFIDKRVRSKDSGSLETWNHGDLTFDIAGVFSRSKLPFLTPELVWERLPRLYPIDRVRGLLNSHIHYYGGAGRHWERVGWGMFRRKDITA